MVQYGFAVFAYIAHDLRDETFAESGACYWGPQNADAVSNLMWHAIFG